MVERAEVMTDYQMRTLLNMIITIVDDSEKKEEVKQKLIAIRDGEFASRKKSKNEPED